MKKYTVLFAALAVIALAGCKKEENGMVNIKVGGENYQNMDKQGYSTTYNFVMFQDGDQILFNGTAYPIVLQNEDPMFPGFSNFASFSVPATEIGGETTILYPANIFQSGLYVEESAADLIMVDMADATVNQISGCVWPMGYHVADFHSHGDILLKNAVALIIPSIKYGPRCFQQLVANNTDFEALGTITLANMPTMTVTKVELQADTMLTGNAHVEFNTSNDPIMKMDDPMTTAYTVLAAGAPNMGVDIPASSNGETYVGGIPVTPDLAGHNVIMRIYFDLTFTTEATDVAPAATHVYHCLYTSPERNVNGDVARNHYTVFCANMNGGDYYSRISRLGID